MIAFIEENRDIGVELLCKHLPIAPSMWTCCGFVLRL